jgi:hypothetical protein
MWEVLKKGTAVQKEKTALRMNDVANAVRRLWKTDEEGRIPAWAPRSGNGCGFLGDCL